MNKLRLIQTELKAPKSQYNSFAKYKYRSCEDILEAVKPLLKKHECTLTVSDEIIEVGGRVYVRAEAYIQDSENESMSVYAMAREPEDKKGMDASQITGTASSYARKYALNGLFLIDDTKDADTMDNSELPKLEKGSENYKKVVKALQGDFTIDQVKKKYTLTSELEEELKNI